MVQKFVKVITSVIILLALPACAPQNEQEVLRISAPDEIVDVVVTKMDTDATVSTPTKIYIVPKNMGVHGENPLLVADHFDLKSVSWSNRNLIIVFYNGRIFQYQNRWSSQKINDFKYEVKIFLKDANSPE